MRHAAEVRLAGSVGRGGLNRWPDVAAVQQLLNEHLPSGVRPLVIDGDAGPLTVDLIARWQRRHGIVRQPDGRVDPGGPTLRALNGARRVHSIPRAEVRKAPPPVAPLFRVVLHARLGRRSQLPAQRHRLPIPWPRAGARHPMR